MEDKILHKDLSYKSQGLFFDVRNDLGLGRLVVAVFVVICLFLFVAIRGVQATEIFFETAGQKVGVGEEFEATIYLNTENETVNATGVIVNYPVDLIELEDWSDGGSIINYWVKRPQTGEGSVSFEGVILGAFNSDKGRLVSLKFKALKEGIGSISFSPSSQILLHDGKGTKARLSTKGLDFEIVSGKPFLPSIIIEDTEPPEPFLPIVARDPNIFGGKWFLIFGTNDKGSGIDYYEVIETNSFWALRKAEPRRAESPELLEDQSLQSIIRVRAVDKVGNERLAELPAKYLAPFVWYKNFAVWIIILLWLIASAGIGFVVWRGIFLPPLEKGD
ncbi:cohesin domain-containing protein [Patescibacteria group bacterium]|nr:cohesin domain-containing protein [Patescibacteria group bacterium]